MSLPSLSRPASAALTAAATTAYYACPDVVRTRRGRAWTKTAAMGVLSLTSVAEWQEMRRADAAAGPTAETAAEPAGPQDVAEPAPAHRGEEGAGLGVRQKVVLGAAAAGLLAAGVAGVVLAERWVFARGERRRAEGHRFSHSRQALVLGALAGVMTLVPPPETD